MQNLLLQVLGAQEIPSNENFESNSGAVRAFPIRFVHERRARRRRGEK